MSIVGIDFGMENIKVSIAVGQKVSTINLDSKEKENHVAPNAVYYKKNEEGGIEKFFFGCNEARNAKLQNSPDYIRHIKRGLQLENWQKSICGGRTVKTLDSILFDIFSEIRNRICNVTQDSDIEAILTVPVNFAESQKNRLAYNAEKAGIRVREFITEPFAALFSSDIFSCIMDCKERKNIVIFDFGGSTLDICMASVIPENGKKRISILASNGMQYGGVDISNGICDSLVKPFFKEEIEADKENIEFFIKRIFDLLEGVKSKIYNSDADEYETKMLDFGGKQLEIGRQTFNGYLEKEGIGNRIRTLFDNMLESINEESMCDDLEYSDFSEVFMIGGTSRITYFQDLIRDIFGNDDIIDEDILEDDENIYNSVANGAAAFVGYSEDYLIDQKISMSIGIDRGKGYEILLNKNTSYGERSAKKTIAFSFVESNNGLIRVYQSLSDKLTFGKCYDVTDPDILFSGYVKLNTDLYDRHKNISVECCQIKKGILIETFQEGSEDYIERIELKSF